MSALRPTAPHAGLDAAWAFLVVSDPGQADTLQDQQAWAKEAAAAKNWVLTKVVSGVSSGKLGARGLSLDMIGALEALPASERPKRILMIRLERLGRGNGLEAMEAFLRIRRLGIVVHTRIDGDVGYDRASELLMPVLRFFIGGMENEVRRDKLKAMYARKRKASEADSTIAVSTTAAYGLAIVNGRYVPKAPEDAAVRLAYELKVQGYGSHRISKKLAATAPPWILKSGAAKPQVWTSDRVRRLIIKPAYRGTIVDDETWYRAQRPVREVRRPTIHHEYPLGGALTCECGHALIGHAGPGKARSSWRYYQCRNALKHGRMKHHRTDLIEAQFLQLLGRLAADKALVERYVLGLNNIDGSAALMSQIGTLVAELESNDERRRQIFQAFEAGDLASNDLQWRLDDLRHKQLEQENRLKALRDEVTINRARVMSTRDVERLLAGAASSWSSGPIDDKRALAKALSIAFGGLIVSIDGELCVGCLRR